MRPSGYRCRMSPRELGASSCIPANSVTEALNAWAVYSSRRSRTAQRKGENETGQIFHRTLSLVGFRFSSRTHKAGNIPEPYKHRRRSQPRKKYRT